MSKIWAGLTDGELNELADKFNASINFDSKLYKYDILGSISHVNMLAKQGIISEEDKDKIESCLTQIMQDISNGKLDIDDNAEDIHSFVEAELTSRIGDTGKKLHTARSRNDQVALDLKLYLVDQTRDNISLLENLINTLCDKANEYKSAIMPGYTHLQRAQPINFGHQLLAYAWMFLRDWQRFSDSLKRMNTSPIGSCALAGTTYDTDRDFEASDLGFEKPCQNSIDGVSDRDFCLEFLSNASILMMHTSRLCEELILWSSWEFKFINLPSGFTTGSSIMPNKKNPDMAELIRGKTGRVYGNLFSLLTVMKSLPLAYNKDMQEDKECVFDTAETINNVLDILKAMILGLTANEENMLQAAQKGFINATDAADYLTKSGVAFRDAYITTGKLVAYCQENNKVLEELTIDEFKKFDTHFKEDIFDVINLKNCVDRRTSYGGTSTANVGSQIKELKDILNN